MRRVLRVICLVVGLLPGFAVAQTAQPILRQEAEETSVVPGQTVILRLTVLVPTFMPDPPQFPSFETPNLMVRLPSRSTSPTSEQIDGETWSGLTRAYRITPLTGGQFAIPAQDLTLSYQDPAGSDTLSVTLQTEPLTITGVVPPNATELDPFVAADSLTLEQTIDGTPEAMAPGDALVRTVTITTTNAPALMIPDVFGAGADLDGLSIYPDEPALNETDNRGTLSATRTQSVTYVAAGGGAYTLPEITLQWYNVSSDAVETATLPAIELSVDGPVRIAPNTPRDWRAIGLAAAAGLALIAAILWGVSRVLPPLRAAVTRRKARYLASEKHAWAQVEGALKIRDLTALNRSFRQWRTKAVGSKSLSQSAQTALQKITQARFGVNPADGSAQDWENLERMLTTFRQDARAAPQSQDRFKTLRLNP